MLPIIEKILGNNNLLTNTYIKDTINLTKSIVIKTDIEANEYNKYISIKYPNHVIDKSNKSTWRYYKHLSCQYHELDTPITLISIDNGASITLTKSNINLHKRTKEELLKFSLFYKELVDKYPEQELYIKSVITYNQVTDINDIINLKDYSIVSYNSDLIEENENDLIFELQQSIENYKNIRLIPYYSLSDNLFLASQYHILYNFILTKILAIRLKNAKTLKAHSYHIKNYLASHHYLDEYYSYLTKKQSLFLYKNLLYLNNHSGRNDVFNILIEKLFTERNISLVNYFYKQINSTDESNYINYKFNQKLLNKTSLVYSTYNYSLNNIKDKELDIANGNFKELTYNLSKIDKKFKNSLFNILLTKDLETIIIDNTDTVKYKIIPTIVNYWAMLLKQNKINFLVTITDPVTNKELILNTSDLFKLFVIILYKANNVTLTEFPVFYIENVFKTTLPSTDELLEICYHKYYWYKEIIDTIKANISSYSDIFTSSQFEEHVFSIYKLNIGLWLFLTNLDDKDTNGQFELIIERLNTTERYEFDSESINGFLTRIGFNDVMTYDKSMLDSLLYSILNNLYDNKLSFLNVYKQIQQSLIEIFKKFSSYTTQFISNYYSSNPVLTGLKDTRYVVSEDKHSIVYNYDQYLFNVDMNYDISFYKEIEFKNDCYHTCKYKDNLNIDISADKNFNSKSINTASVYFSNKILNDLGDYNWIVSQSSDDQLEFLAINL